MKSLPLLLLITSLYGIEFTSINKQYDGDTFNIDIENCYEPVLCKNVPIRVKGVDTPEIKGHSIEEKTLAIQAKNYTTAFLKRPGIKLTECTRDKYFRLDCYVIDSNGNDLSKELIQKRLGVSYGGSTKVTDWKLFR